MIAKFVIREGHIREFQIDKSIHYMDSLVYSHNGLEISITPSGHSVHCEHPLRGYHADIKNGILRVYRHSDTKIETLTQRFVAGSNATLNGTLVVSIIGNRELHASFFDLEFEKFLHSHKILSAVYASPNQRWIVDNDEMFATDGTKTIEALPSGKISYQVSGANYVFIASQRLDQNGVSVFRSVIYSVKNPVDLDLESIK